MHQVELGSVVRIIMLKALVFYHLLHRSAHRTEAWILKTLDAWDSFTDLISLELVKQLSLHNKRHNIKHVFF